MHLERGSVISYREGQEKFKFAEINDKRNDNEVQNLSWGEVQWDGTETRKNCWTKHGIRFSDKYDTVLLMNSDTVRHRNLAFYEEV